MSDPPRITHVQSESTARPPDSSASWNREGLGLSELFTIVGRRKWVIAAAVLVGALIGFAGSKLVTPSWKATALVEIGQVRQMTPSAMHPMAQELVESPPRAAERVNDPAFVYQLLGQMGLPQDERSGNAEADLIRSSLRVTTPKGTDLLEVQVWGLNPEKARGTVVMVVELLARAHAQIAEATLMRLRGQLKAVGNELGIASAERTKLIDMVKDRDAVGVGNRFAESVLLGNLISNKDQEIRELRDRQLQLEEQLSPSRTFPTALLSGVYVPSQPSFPQHSLFASAGAAIGLLAALLWALATTPVRVSKPARFCGST